MSRFKSVHPLMIYLDKRSQTKLKKFATNNQASVSQIAREGLKMRLTQDHPYNTGWNDALIAAMDVVRKTKGAQMMFPSGKSFADIVCEEIEHIVREFNHDEKLNELYGISDQRDADGEAGGDDAVRPDACGIRSDDGDGGVCGQPEEEPSLQPPAGPAEPA